MFVSMINSSIYSPKPKNVMKAIFAFLFALVVCFVGSASTAVSDTVNTEVGVVSFVDVDALEAEFTIVSSTEVADVGFTPFLYRSCMTFDADWPPGYVRSIKRMPVESELELANIRHVTKGHTHLPNLAYTMGVDPIKQC